MPGSAVWWAPKNPEGLRLNPHPSAPAPDYGKPELVHPDDREYLRWSEGFAIRRRRERERTGKVRIEPAALSIISAAAEFGVRSLLSRQFDLGDRRILRYQDPELGDHLRGRYRFRELDAVAFSHGHPSAVFEFKLSGLGSVSAVNRAARQLRSAAEMIRQGYGHQPKVAVVLIHAGDGHPDLGKPGGRYGVRHHPPQRLHLQQWPDIPIPCLVFSMREAVEEARRIGHEVDHALEKRAAREGKHGIQQGRRILPRLPLGEVLSAVSWMAKELVQAVSHVARKLTPRRRPSPHSHRRRRRRRRGRGHRPGGHSHGT
jgi:hypothetical protein